MRIARAALLACLALCAAASATPNAPKPFDSSCVISVIRDRAQRPSSADSMLAMRVCNDPERELLRVAKMPVNSSFTASLFMQFWNDALTRAVRNGPPDVREAVASWLYASDLLHLVTKLHLDGTRTNELVKKLLAKEYHEINDDFANVYAQLVLVSGTHAKKAQMTLLAEALKQNPTMLYCVLAELAAAAQWRTINRLHVNDPELLANLSLNLVTQAVYKRSPQTYSEIILGLFMLFGKFKFAENLIYNEIFYKRPLNAAFIALGVLESTEPDRLPAIFFNKFDTVSSALGNSLMVPVNERGFKMLLWEAHRRGKTVECGHILLMFAHFRRHALDPAHFRWMLDIGGPSLFEDSLFSNLKGAEWLVLQFVQLIYEADVLDRTFPALNKMPERICDRHGITMTNVMNYALSHNAHVTAFMIFLRGNVTLEEITQPVALTVEFATVISKMLDKIAVVGKFEFRFEKNVLVVSDTEKHRILCRAARWIMMASEINYDAVVKLFESSNHYNSSAISYAAERSMRLLHHF